jgi:hypothetical protein
MVRAGSTCAARSGRPRDPGRALGSPGDLAWVLADGNPMRVLLQPRRSAAATSLPLFDA